MRTGIKETGEDEIKQDGKTRDDDTLKVLD